MNAMCNLGEFYTVQVRYTEGTSYSYIHVPGPVSLALHSNSAGHSHKRNTPRDTLQIQ